jgi:hypothetical protein
MKRIKQILIAGALLALIPVVQTVVVLAQGGDELKPDIGAPGANGWYRTDVEIRWPLPPRTTVLQGCDDTTINNDTVSVVLDCVVESKEGILSGTVEVKRDATPPTVITDPAGRYVELKEGDTLLLDASESTDKTSGVARITWDLLELDGAVAGIGNSTNFPNVDVYDLKNPVNLLAEDGPGAAKFSTQVTDVAGNSVSVVVIVILANTAPELSEISLSAHEIRVGDKVELEVAYSDPGVLDTHTASVDWGDGTVESGFTYDDMNTVTGAHTYAESGVYTIEVIVTDKDGDSDKASASVVVQAL